MANFIGLVYATLKKEGIDTSNMSTDEAVKKFKELQGSDEKESPEDVKKKLNGEKTQEKSEKEPEDVKKELNGETKYPAGTSKEYTEKVNKRFEQALPVLEQAGIKLEDFGGKASKEGGYEDNTEEIMNKYVFEPFREKYPQGNNDAWEKEYQPLYNAIEAVFDKNYNDWYIKNK